MPALVNAVAIGQVILVLNAVNFNQSNGLFIDAPGNFLLSFLVFQRFLQYYVAMELFLQTSGIGQFCALLAQTLDADGNVLEEESITSVDTRLRLSLIAAAVAFRLTFEDLQQNGCNGAFVQLMDGQLVPPTAVSSIRFKRDVRPLLPAGRTVLGLRPVAYRYRAPWGDPAIPRVGLIAEEIVRVYPEAVVPGSDGKPYAIRYDVLAELLVENGVDRIVQALRRASPPSVFR